MRKKVGIIKRVSCIALIFLLSINSFAAIVSDNDGSAFITKAEFDALKSSFQSQIDTYNQSIDSKIDGAIASYLSGITLIKNSDIMMPGNQRNFKTLDKINYPVEFDNWNVTATYIQMYGYGPNVAFPAYSVYFRYKQNNIDPYTNSVVVKPLSNGSRWNIEGYSNDFVRKVEMNWLDFQKNKWRLDTIYQRYKNVGLVGMWHDYHTFYVSGRTAGYSYADTAVTNLHQDKTWAAYKFYCTQDDGYNTIGFSCAESDNMSVDGVTGLTRDDCVYTLNADKIMMPLGPSRNFPVQLNNSGSQQPNNRADMDYVTKPSKDIDVGGWFIQGKRINDTTNPYGADDIGDEVAVDAVIPWGSFKPELLSKSIYQPAQTLYLRDEYAYYYSSDDFFGNDTNTYTTEYNNTGIKDALKSRYGSYWYSENGEDYFSLSGGLVLCYIDKKGILQLSVTNKNDNPTYLFLYDKPTLMSSQGLNVLGDSDTTKGNGILLPARAKKTIKVDVTDGFYFFRFGTIGAISGGGTGGVWNDLGPGSEIEFDQKFIISYTD